MSSSPQMTKALETARTLVAHLASELWRAADKRGRVPDGLAEFVSAESPSVVLLASLMVRNDHGLARQAAARVASDGAEPADRHPAQAGIGRDALANRLDELKPWQLVDYVRTRPNPSRRSQYNLACYYTTLARLGGEDFLELCLDHALESLDASLEGGGLVEWAGADPSLEALRTARKGDFTEAIARNTVSPHPAAGEKS